MDKNTRNVMEKLAVEGVKVAKEAANPLNVNNSQVRSAEIKKLETFLKSAEETFKAETGRPMTYSEMRAMFG
jgi:predicted ArsR family transcriptional regulator